MSELSEQSDSRAPTRREASEQNYNAAQIGTPDETIAHMLYAIWHELRHIGDLLTPPPTKGSSS